MMRTGALDFLVNPAVQEPDIRGTIARNGQRCTAMLLRKNVICGFCVWYRFNDAVIRREYRTAALLSPAPIEMGSQRSTPLFFSA
jgi:hypothetical protein